MSDKDFDEVFEANRAAFAGASIINLDEVREQMRRDREVEVPVEVSIEVPGCTCASRSNAQLSSGDVCPACVAYFDLDDDDEEGD